MHENYAVTHNSAYFGEANIPKYINQTPDHPMYSSYVNVERPRYNQYPVRREPQYYKPSHEEQNYYYANRQNPQFNQRYLNKNYGYCDQGCCNMNYRPVQSTFYPSSYHRDDREDFAQYNNSYVPRTNFYEPYDNRERFDRRYQQQNSYFTYER